MRIVNQMDSGDRENIRVGFTGTQKGVTDRQFGTLKAWLIHLREGGALWMDNGDCVGADDEAGTIWGGLGGLIHLHPPSIAAKRVYLAHSASEAPLPYLARNKQIVLFSKCLVATPAEDVEQPRGGTWSTVRFARKLERPILKIFPDGSYAGENWQYILAEIGGLTA